MKRQQNRFYLIVIIFVFILFPLFAACPEGDLTGDCIVGIDDLVVFADQWLDPHGCLGHPDDCADLVGNDGVKLPDFAVLAEAWNVQPPVTVVINEIHYHPDNNTEQVEFVELYNAGSEPVNLNGWSLDGAIAYTFESTPAMQPGDYVVVCENPGELNSKFGVSGYGPFIGKLSNDGEALTLRNAAGDKVDEVDYDSDFPWPIAANGEGASMELINPSLDNNLAGSWRSSGYVENPRPESSFGMPTPGAVNSVYADNAPPQIRQVQHQPENPKAGEKVVITAKITDPNGIKKVYLYYQVVSPGNYIPAYLPISITSLIGDPYQEQPQNPAFESNWSILLMNDSGTGSDLVANDHIYTQSFNFGHQNRTLIRYRIKAWDNLDHSIRVPYADDPSLNFAYFVYDGVPEYKVYGDNSVNPDAESGTYYTYTTDVMTSLPVYMLITREADLYQCNGYDSSDRINQAAWPPNENEQAAGRAYNWEGCFVYDGKVYDHIGYRLRGGNGRYNNGRGGKRSMKFRFNRGNYFQARDLYGKKFPSKWQHLNIGKMLGNWYGYTGYDGYMYGINEMMDVRLWSIADVPAPKEYWFTFRVVDGIDESIITPTGHFYGDFWGLYVAFENYDGAFLDRLDLPKGNVYKLSDKEYDGLIQLRYQGENAVDDASDYETIRTQLNHTASADWIRNHLDCDEWYRYHTVIEAIRSFDQFSGGYCQHCMKNLAWYFYPDYTAENNYLGKVQFMPFDYDDSWGPYFNKGVDHAKAAIYDQEYLMESGPTQYAIQPEKSPLKQEYRNYIREYRDLMWQEDVIYPMISELASVIADIVPADRDRWRLEPGFTNDNRSDPGPLEPIVAGLESFAFQPTSIFAYWPGTSNNLDALANTDGDSSNIPNTPTISYIGAAGYPENDLRFETSNFSDPQGSSTFAAMKWRIARVGSEPVEGSLLPRHYYELNAVWDSNELTTFDSQIRIPADGVSPGKTYRVRCKMKDTTGRWSHWSAPIEFVAGEALGTDLRDHLRITEVMYNNGDAEFIELQNTGTTTLNLEDVSFTDGVTFSFDGSQVESLAPGAYVLVIKDRAAFEAQYGNGYDDIIAGEFTDGSLSNGGETLKLEDTWNGTIVEFEYNDARGWPLAADGAGHSLVPLVGAIDPSQPKNVLNYGGNWRQSTYIGGSPGAADPTPAAGVVINEFMAHTDFSDPSYPDYDSNDWIELYNAGGSTVNLNGNWYLSDDVDDLKKWGLPAISLPAGGWVSFNEVSGFHNPITSGFGLDKAGEQIFLSYLPGTGQDRVVDSLVFKGQENDVSLGRYPDGGDYWFSLSPSTRNGANQNALPHVVISEIMYHPADGTTDPEYVEIYNPTGSAASLTTSLPSAGDRGWELDGAVSYEFGTDTPTLAANGRILVVGFDPTDTAALDAFEASYGISDLTAGVNIFGPWIGDLSNGGERLTLEKPQDSDDPLDPLAVSWIIVDECIYNDAWPWPSEPDGTGTTLHRVSQSATDSGNDPGNWQSDTPSPGS